MMSPEEIRLEVEKRLLKPVSDGRLEVVVTYRRHDDYAEYETTISSLKEEIKNLKHDVFVFSQMGQEYLKCLDELNRLKRLLRKNKIDF